MQKILIIDPANPSCPAEWRTYNGLDFLIAPMLVTDVRRIRKEVADLGLDEMAAANELDARMADHVIRDWRGPVTPARAKLPVTKANKFALVNLLPGVKAWLLPESDRVAEAQIKAVEEQLGNSGDSPAGMPSAPGEKTGEA